MLTFLLLQCRKTEMENKDNKINIEYPETDAKPNIDFESMKKLVDESKTLDIDVFFAISVLHKNYISQFEEQVKDLSEEEQKDFFHKKKKEFFNSIKYSEDDYNNFMQKNIDLMNEYINRHKEIEEYLLSI